MVLGLFKKRYHPSASSELTSEYYSLELWPFLIIQCFLISLSFKSTPTGSGFQPKNAGVLYYYALSTTALFTKRVTTFVVFISSSPPSPSSSSGLASYIKESSGKLDIFGYCCSLPACYWPWDYCCLPPPSSKYFDHSLKLDFVLVNWHPPWNVIRVTIFIGPSRNTKLTFVKWGWKLEKMEFT